MRYSISEVESFKHADSELLARLIDNLPKESEENEMEELHFEMNGSHFSVVEVDEDDCVSDGKYENGGTHYQLVEFDKTIKSYPCDESIVAKYNVEIFVGWYRTGSYYTDWYYMYDEPTVYQIQLETVPEQIIPEHQEVVIKPLG